MIPTGCKHSVIPWLGGCRPSGDTPPEVLDTGCLVVISCGCHGQQRSQRCGRRRVLARRGGALAGRGRAVSGQSSRGGSPGGGQRGAAGPGRGPGGSGRRAHREGDHAGEACVRGVVGEGGQAGAGRGRHGRRAGDAAWPRAAAGLAWARPSGLLPSADPRGGPRRPCGRAGVPVLRRGLCAVRGGEQRAERLAGAPHADRAPPPGLPAYLPLPGPWGVGRAATVQGDRQGPVVHRVFGPVAGGEVCAGSPGPPHRRRAGP